jgi:hypothetical protein
LHASDPLPGMVDDFRLGLEITVIQSLADHLVRMLQVRDPLSERVHLRAAGVIGIGATAVVSGILRRFRRRLTAGSYRPRDA